MDINTLMSLSFYPVFLSVLLGLCTQGVYPNAVTLEPTAIDVQENNSVILTCTGANNISGWQLLESGLWAYIVIQNGETCRASGFIFGNPSLYSWKCHRNGSFSLTLLRVKRQQHGDKWICRNLFTAISNVVAINVKVPATGVALSAPNGNNMKENSSQNFTCITSGCRPFPLIQWYLRDSDDEVVYNLTQFSSNTYVDKEYGLKSVESRIYFEPNRTVNGLRLYCEVWTQSDKVDAISRDIILNITYPPDDYPKIEGIEKNNTLEILESDTGFFVCSVTGGNPLASLSWNCFDSNDTTLNIHGNIVTSKVKWTANRNYRTCSCTAYHMSVWMRVSNITIDVQFPTKIRIVSSNSNTGRENVVINETHNATLVCLAEANPSSNITIENPKGDNILKESYSNIARHTLWNVTYLDAGVYTCRGKNKYTRGQPASSQLTLIVTCPPKPSSGSESVVTLATAIHVGVTLSFSVLRYLDVPNKTIFRWFRGNEYISEHDNRYIVRSEEFQTNLSILNTSDRDLGLYQVSVWNSFGEYTHYYVLNAAAHRSMETVSSNHIGEFIGVGAGGCSITLVVVAFIFIGYKRAKKVKFSNRKRDKQGDIVDHKPSVRKGNHVFSAYAELDTNKKESNEYDTVNVSSTSSEQQDLSTLEGASAYIEMKDAIHVTKDTKEYVNITI